MVSRNVSGFMRKETVGADTKSEHVRAVGALQLLEYAVLLDAARDEDGGFSRKPLARKVDRLNRLFTHELVDLKLGYRPYVLFDERQRCRLQRRALQVRRRLDDPERICRRELLAEELSAQFRGDLQLEVLAGPEHLPDGKLGELERPAVSVLHYAPQRRRVDAAQRQHVVLVHRRHVAENHPVEGRRHRSQHHTVCLNLNGRHRCACRGGAVLQPGRHTNGDVAALAIAPELCQSRLKAGARRLVAQAHRLRRCGGGAVVDAGALRRLSVWHVSVVRLRLDLNSTALGRMLYMWEGCYITAHKTVSSFFKITRRAVWLPPCSEMRAESQILALFVLH